MSTFKSPPEKLYGPDGIEVWLDVSEVFPEDPGQGTPCMVKLGSYWGSFNAASETGEVDGEPLTFEQSKWLEEIADEVDDWLSEQVKLKEVECNSALTNATPTCRNGLS